MICLYKSSWPQEVQPFLEPIWICSKLFHDIFGQSSCWWAMDGWMVVAGSMGIDRRHVLLTHTHTHMHTHVHTHTCTHTCTLIHMDTHTHKARTHIYWHCTRTRIGVNHIHCINTPTHAHTIGKLNFCLHESFTNNVD